MVDSRTIREKIWTMRWPLMAGLITAVGLLLRIWDAWVKQYSANGDFGIVALMAKHMAEGTDFPVFAYGVAYMGSLEPAIAVLLSKIFHVEVSPFLVDLSPALVGTLLLPLLYVFGRDAGSRRAGLIAMLYCLVGSDTLFHYTAAPRGGYMNMMVGGLTTLWLACRIATQERRREPISWRTYLYMGLAAGIGWWSTQLVVVFLAASLVILLTGFRWRMVRKGFLPALAGFFIGGLPWWIWNVNHNWASLSFGSSQAKIPPSKALESFGDLFLRVVEMPEPTFCWTDGLRLLLLICTLSGFAVMVIIDRVRKERDETLFYRVAMSLLMIFMILFHVTSPFAGVNATRYLLPIVPAIAVMIGVTIDRLLCRFRIPVGWLVFAMIIPTHILLLNKMPLPGTALPEKSLWEQASRLTKEIAPLCDGVFLGDYYRYHWHNFASHERICVAALPRERYAPYAVKAELAEKRAYLDNYCHINSFFYATGSKSLQTYIGDTLIDYAIKPPSDKWRYLAPVEIIEAIDTAGKNCHDVLLGSEMDSSIRTVVQSKSSASITFTLSRCARICGLRLFSLDDRYPWKMSLESRADDDTPWLTVMPPIYSTEFFWSGPYIMMDGVQFFQELRFDSPSNGIKELRFTIYGDDDRDRLASISQILFLEEDNEQQSDQFPSVKQCITALQDKGINQFYAPRWLAERIHMATSNTMTTLVPSLLTRAIDELPLQDSRIPLPLPFVKATALFMDKRDAPRTRHVLSEAGLSFQEIPLGSMVMLAVAKDNSATSDINNFHAYWTEHGCFSSITGKGKAQMLFESINANTTNEAVTNKIETLQKALQLYPAHEPARQLLATTLAAAGRNEESATNAAALKTLFQPQYPAHIRFNNGIELLGVNLLSATAKPGQTLDIAYLWKCPPSLDPEKLAVFVHFQSGKMRFQDDHVFLISYSPQDISYQPFKEVFTESRRVTIPASTPPGDYRLMIGLLDRIDNRRLGFKTSQINLKRAVELPVVIKVTQ